MLNSKLSAHGCAGSLYRLAISVSVGELRQNCSNPFLYSLRVKEGTKIPEKNSFEGDQEKDLTLLCKGTLLKDFVTEGLA